MYFERQKVKRFTKQTRNITCVFLVCVVLFVFTVRIFQLQIIDHKFYSRESAISSASSVAVKATRGEILDRYGRQIAINREGYNVIFDYSYLPLSQMNNVILTIWDLLEENEDTFRDKLPLTQKFPFAFLEDENSSNVKVLKSKLGLNSYATIDNIYQTMIETFELHSFAPKHQRILMGVRYTMLLEDFSISYPYTFAEDVSESTRSKILEASDNFPGVKIEEVAVREYVAGDYGAQIIGNVGPIYAEDWETLKAKGYSYSDYVGKTGVESAFEDYLRGRDGINKVVKNKETGAIEVVPVKEAVAGNTVMLTIDLEVQKVAQNSLKKVIQDIRSTGVKATNGAIVCVNVNTGEIIASANYPSFTLDEYKNEYNKLASDSSLPLFDRAFQGTYPPGSTFKPAIAAVGLTVNEVTSKEHIYCKRYYDYYKDMTFKCLGYHGPVNIVTALSKSCNYYFYETGRRIGINVLNEYSQLMGLGVKTGVELKESSGVLAGPSFAKSIGTYWRPGDTLQFAIGQSYNLFTPLQLATYTATIANGGTRYQSHLLHKVKSYDLSRTIKDHEINVLANTGLSSSAIDTVKKGMLSAAFEGTASSVFGDYKIQVGGKTGTAQTVGNDNGVFIAFAPYENSEIAVAIVVEHAEHGYVCAPAVKDVFDAYFFSKNEQAKKQEINQLLD